MRLQTGSTAEVYGFDDRGTLEVGKRADINLVDLDALTLHAPEMIFDLPADGRRLVQRVDGYRATFVAGVQTYADGEPPEPRPAAWCASARSRTNLSSVPGTECTTSISGGPGRRRP